MDVFSLTFFAAESSRDPQVSAPSSTCFQALNRTYSHFRRAGRTARPQLCQSGHDTFVKRLEKTSARWHRVDPHLSQLDQYHVCTLACPRALHSQVSTVRYNGVQPIGLACTTERDAAMRRRCPREDMREFQARGQGQRCSSSQAAAAACSSSQTQVQWR